MTGRVARPDGGRGDLPDAGWAWGEVIGAEGRAVGASGQAGAAGVEGAVPGRFQGLCPALPCGRLRRMAATCPHCSSAACARSLASWASRRRVRTERGMVCVPACCRARHRKSPCFAVAARGGSGRTHPGTGPSETAGADRADLPVATGRARMTGLVAGPAGGPGDAPDAGRAAAEAVGAERGVVGVSGDAGAAPAWSLASLAPRRGERTGRGMACVPACCRARTMPCLPSCRRADRAEPATDPGEAADAERRAVPISGSQIGVAGSGAVSVQRHDPGAASPWRGRGRAAGMMRAHRHPPFASQWCVTSMRPAGAAAVAVRQAALRRGGYVGPPHPRERPVR